MSGSDLTGLGVGAGGGLGTAAGAWRRLAAMGLLCAAVMLPLAGCSSLPGGTTASVENPDPPEKMFADADKLLNSGYYKDAAEKYEDLERSYPFSDDPSKPYARKSLALASFAYYKAGDYDSAIASGMRFISLHAGSEDAPLAHHVVGMSYYDQMQDARALCSERRIGPIRVPAPTGVVDVPEPIEVMDLRSPDIGLVPTSRRSCPDLHRILF